jgi:hypothetical protein
MVAIGKKDGHGLRSTFPFAFWPYLHRQEFGTKDSNRGIRSRKSNPLRHDRERQTRPPGAVDSRGCSLVTVNYAVPPGAPAWVTPELITDTLRVWQPYYDIPLTADDALDMIVHVWQLFDVLYGDKP